MSSLERSGPVWRDDIDALAFRPERHDGVCVMHQLAFRTLIGRLPDVEDCFAFFRSFRSAFDAAAATKIVGQCLESTANFHLTSREVAAWLAKADRR